MASRAIKGRHSTVTSHKKTGLLVVLTVLISVFAAGVIGLYGLGSSWLSSLPDYANAYVYNVAKPTTIYASDGQTVLAEFQSENREPVAFEQISDYVKEGTIATEDERFYEHNGVDVMGIARALANNLLGGQLEGASTITQQFVRNTILADEMGDITLKRKVREAYISLKLEEQYGKDEILLMYLNTINYGSGAYGIQSAAQRYFSKNATDLTLAEAATLVGIPQSPTYNNPIDNPDNCLTRRNVVLDRMVANGYITADEAAAAKAEPIALNPHISISTGIYSNPYFVTYVKNQLTDLNGKYGYSTSDIYSGGLSVYTTLDLGAQNAANEAAANKERQVSSRFEVALAAVDPDNGYIKAMVGGDDFNESQINMATGEGGSGRQPGSSFKTFTLAAAIENGVDPRTNIDASTTATFPGWKVSNINYVNYGTRTIASAFHVSSNTAFARLIQAIGTDSVVNMAHKLGIKSPLDSTPSLTLGTSSVTPLEMASAYATLANGGTRYDPECIIKIVDRSGNVVVDNSNPAGERVISPEVAHATVEVMKGVITQGTGKAAALKDQVAAGKTGTSDTYKDSWFCGITPQMAVAIWLGDRSDYNVAASVPSGVTAASAFSDFMNRVLAGQPSEDFPQAGDPPYKKFSSEQYHIGGYYGYGDTNADAKATDATPNNFNSSNSAGSTNNGATGAGSGSSSTGGATGGGATGGGSTGGGSTSGGDVGGGGTGGGSTGGGSTGGGDVGGGGATGGGTGGGSTGGGSTGGGGGGSTGGGSTGGGATGGGGGAEAA